MDNSVMKDLVGTWNLEEWDALADGSFHNYPFGREAQGRISYAADGYMSAILMRPDRPDFAKPSLFKGTAAEKLAALHGYVSYAGTFSTKGDLVTHHVQFSLLPNWIGTDLVRRMTWLEDGDLLLTTLGETTSSGALMVNRLRWRKLVR